MNPLNWIYPPRCMACRALLAAGDSARLRYKLCEACQALFVPLAPPLCRRCGHPQEAGYACLSCHGRTFLYESNRSAYAYAGLVRELLHDMKFRNKKACAAGMGALLADFCTAEDFAGADCLVPVPMHPKKERMRGFNQATVMAQVLSVRFGVRTETRLLRRIRNTPPQSGLNPAKRAANMDGAFIINPKLSAAGKKFILIDDIHTTGATLNACARSLYEGGAAAVKSVTFSITVKDSGKK